MKRYKVRGEFNAKIFEKGDEDGFMPGAAGDPDIPFVDGGISQYTGEFGKCYLIYRGNGMKRLMNIKSFEEQFEQV